MSYSSFIQQRGITFLLLSAFGMVLALMPQVGRAQMNTFFTPSMAVVSMDVAKMKRAARRAPAMDVAKEVLLASIPSSHPMRDELRFIAQQVAPAGYSNSEWLALASKVNFRYGVGKRAMQDEALD